MAKTVEGHKRDVNGKIVNSGVDVHKRSWRATGWVEGVSWSWPASRPLIPVGARAPVQALAAATYGGLSTSNKHPHRRG